MKSMEEIIRARHSVRKYTDKKLDGDIKGKIEKLINECNKEGKLNIKLIIDEPKAFDTYYENFKNAKNYVVLSGKKNKNLEEKVGYYGEKIVIRAQELGLNTCWVALTYNKKQIPFKIRPDEKLVVVITIGYGENQGISRKSKSFEKVSKTSNNNVPQWYKRGIEFALLAPTAMNQQQFRFELIGENIVKATTALGIHTKVDLGIVKYHFELGAGKENFKWYNS